MKGLLIAGVVLNAIAMFVALSTGGLGFLIVGAVGFTCCLGGLVFVHVFQMLFDFLEQENEKQFRRVAKLIRESKQETSEQIVDQLRAEGFFRAGHVSDSELEDILH